MTHMANVLPIKFEKLAIAFNFVSLSRRRSNEGIVSDIAPRNREIGQVARQTVLILSGLDPRFIVNTLSVKVKAGPNGSPLIGDWPHTIRIDGRADMPSRKDKIQSFLIIFR